MPSEKHTIFPKSPPLLLQGINPPDFEKEKYRFITRQKVFYVFARTAFDDQFGRMEVESCSFYYFNSPVKHLCHGHNRPVSSSSAAPSAPPPRSEVVPFSQRANIQATRLLLFARRVRIGSDPFKTGTPFFVRIFLKNRGSTPANQYAAATRLFITSSSSEKEDQEKAYAAVRTIVDGMAYGENSLPPEPEREDHIDVQYPNAHFNDLHLFRPLFFAEHLLQTMTS